MALTNPSNIVRIRSRPNGHASVYEANAWAQAYNVGLFTGTGVQPNTQANMNVLVGTANSGKPDVVIAQNTAGYKIALDIVGQALLPITAPASNSRITAIVAYSDDLALSSTDLMTTGSPSSCGLLVVNGTAAASPSAPTDAQIRSAITADGATGSQAVYAIICYITVASNTTAITSTLITSNVAKLARSGVVTADNIDLTTLNSQAETIIARTTLSANANTITVNIPSNYKYLRAILSVNGQTGYMTHAIRLNGDSSGSYNYRAGQGTGTDNTARAATSIPVGTSSSWANASYYEIQVLNLTGRTKPVNSMFGTAYPNISGSAERRVISGYWANTNQVTSITAFDSTNSSQFNEGSELIVFGYN